VGSACISPCEEEGKSCQDARHVGEFSRKQDWDTVDIFVRVVVVHQRINVLEKEIVEGVFRASSGPGITVDSKDHQVEGCVEATWHLAVVTHLVVKFSASQRGGMVIDGGGNGRDRENPGAEDVLIIKIVVFVSNDVADAARDDALFWVSVRHPSFGWEVGDIGGEGWLCWEWRGFGHGRGEKGRGVKDCHVTWGWKEEEDWTRSCVKCEVGVGKDICI
jgi:hypothetical protein